MFLDKCFIALRIHLFIYLKMWKHCSDNNNDNDNNGYSNNNNNNNNNDFYILFSMWIEFYSCYTIMIWRKNEQQLLQWNVTNLLNSLPTVGSQSSGGTVVHFYLVSCFTNKWC